ncbi:MAG: shikimate dehydrogenase [Nitrospirales bacterium]|nr:shikimate dehydrogenase [Nitrospirales bacterium]
MDINTHTQLCGVLGNPVEHSLSPAIHNAAFQHLSLNFVYLAFQVEDIERAIAGIRALGNIRGLSVTIPHKVSAIPHLNDIDPTAQHIGAINTIVKTQSTLTGYNTDALGALRAIKEQHIPLHDAHVLLVGSGGAARALAFGLAIDGGISKLTIVGIDQRERQELVNDLRQRTPITVKEGDLSQDSLKPMIAEVRLLIHCTPIGMHPNVDASCIPRELLSPHLAIMDIVYNPLETQLLKDAAQAGCQTIPGIDMFLYQAVAQFELWTEQPAPVDVMRRVLESHFS